MTIFDKYKLWIWDFDGTLIRYSTYNKITNPRVITASVLGECFPNWRDFRDLVLHLRRMGCYMGIASFGSSAFIYAFMCRIFGEGQTYFTGANIITPADRADIPADKNGYISQLMRLYSIVGPECVIFFDDNGANIKNAIKMGVNAVKIGNVGEYNYGGLSHNIYDGNNDDYFGFHTIGYYYKNTANISNGYQILYIILIFLFIYGIFIM